VERHCGQIINFENFFKIETFKELNKKTKKKKNTYIKTLRNISIKKKWKKNSNNALRKYCQKSITMYKTIELNDNLEELWRTNICISFQVVIILFRISRNREDDCSLLFNKQIKGEV
jgi:hypothetical protein